MTTDNTRATKYYSDFKPIMIRSKQKQHEFGFRFPHEDGASAGPESYRPPKKKVAELYVPVEMV